MYAPAVHDEIIDHGLTSTNRERPGLRQALAACQDGDTLVVTKLDRLARSLLDARAIADELTARQVRLSLGGSVYDPHDAVARQQAHLASLIAAGQHSMAEVADLFGVSRPTVYRALQRSRSATTA